MLRETMLTEERMLRLGCPRSAAKTAMHKPYDRAAVDQSAHLGQHHTSWRNPVADSGFFASSRVLGRATPCYTLQ